MSILSNAIFLLLNKLFEFISNLTVGVWLINYLGPESQGQYTFFLSLISILSFLSSLGVAPVFSRYSALSTNSANITKYYVNCISLRFLGSVFLFVIAFFVALYNYGSDSLTVVVFLAASKIIFSLNMLPSYAESKGLNRYLLISGFVSILIISALKILIILFKGGIDDLAVIIFFEQILQFSILLYLFRNEFFFKFGLLSLKRMIIIMRKSKMLLISTFVALLFTQSEMIVIGFVLDKYSLGLYSASLKLAAPLAIIPSIITSAFYPTLSRVWVSDKENYFKIMSFLVSLFMIMYIFILLIVFFFGYDLFSIFFDTKYKDAISIFYLNFSYLFFVFIGPLTGKHLVLAKQYNMEFIKTTLGAISSIFLNLILLKSFGVEAAALSAFISFLLANYGFLYLNKSNKDIRQSINNGILMKNLLWGIKSWRFINKCR